MTDTIDWQHARPSPRPWSLREIIAWAIIITTILALLILHFVGETLHKGKAAEREALDQPDIPVLIGGRYAVGVKTAFSRVSPSGDLLRSLEKDAKSDPDRVRVAIVRGEIEGGDAADKSLDALATDDKTLAADIDMLQDIYEGYGVPTGEQWQNFQRRNGWFADLAASYDKPATDPLRAATLHAAERTLVCAVTSMLLLFLAGGAGLILLIVGIVMWSLGKLPIAFPYNPLPAVRTPYVEGFSLYLSLYLVGAVALALLLRFVFHASSAWGMLAMPFSFAIGAFWPILRGQTWAEWRAAMGLHPGKGVFTELACGAAGYIAGLPVFAAGIIISGILVKLTGADASHPITREITGSPLRTAELLLLASVWAPITEELMFRGALFAHLRERFGWWLSASIVSLVFAIIHPQGLAGVPALWSLAIVLAGIREWRGSILGGMMAHAINNTLVLTVVTFMIT